jgi:hypothetical protein
MIYNGEALVLRSIHNALAVVAGEFLGQGGGSRPARGSAMTTPWATMALYRKLGRPYLLADTAVPTKEHMEACRAIVREHFPRVI